MQLRRFFSEALADLVNDRLSTADAPAVNGVAQIELLAADPDEALWFVAFDAGVARVHRGRSPAASFGLIAHVEDFKDLMEGAATLRACLIDGRVKIEGDLALATRLAPLLLPH